MTTFYLFGICLFITIPGCSTSFFFSDTLSMLYSTDYSIKSYDLIEIVFFTNIKNDHNICEISFFNNEIINQLLNFFRNQIFPSLKNSNYINQFFLTIFMFLLYFFFKLGVGPFFTWPIELYNSLPTTLLLIVSLIPKLVYFPLFYFFFYLNFIFFFKIWSSLIFIISLITLLIASLGIFTTFRLKEIYAWSSIIHTCNLLIIFSSFSSFLIQYLITYLIVYTFISISFIASILLLKN